MPAEITEWTADMVRALPDDGKRYEVLDGELFVTPSPSTPHQRALRLLYDFLAPYLNKHAIGEIFWSPADVEFSPRRLLQPDLFVVPFRDGKLLKSWRDIDRLVLAIEALSPTTAHADRHRKRRIYLEEAVDEYWIVDLDARVLERWRKGESRPEVLADALIWQPLAGVEPLTIDLVVYFAGVQRDRT